MHKWSALTAVSIGTFMLLVDVTIVTVALPAISRDLSTSLGGLQWVLDGYALALAAVLLASGALADGHGRRRVYLGGTVVFALASLLCALAPNAGLLIAARFLQGLGGAAMLATTVAILNVAYSGKDRGVAFGIWGAVNGAAAAAGPIAGGLLTEHLGWRWIFLVNLPVSLLAVWFTVRGVTESRGRSDARLDLPGTVTFTLSASAVTFALIRGGDAGWTAPSTLAAFAVSALALIAFIAVERRSDHPMLDLHLFRKPSFSVLMIAALLTQAAAFAYLPFTTVWLQQFLGKGPVDAGLLGALPMSAASFVGGAFAGRFLQRVSPRLTIGLGLLLIGAGALLQARLTPDSSGRALIPGLIVAGLGVAAVLPTMASATLAAVPHERSGMAGGAMNTFRQLGFALGVAVFGSVFAHRLAGHHAPTDAVNHVAAVAGFVALGTAVLVLLVVRVGRPAWEATKPAAAPAGETVQETV
ncbi:MFS transporter [Dactylosporangium matsuzakiense]|uniref:MFS transporter n=1 Tax=Dactylosporangium matsuzakiense TaxID=53360 RepID=A0A9W6KKY8_9ACTN|nr:MFS transporter [Dactylosporangium matsuzakiense]UWZ47322.1 MFS transporter [Dactylosporangium matsuzakiense]GLL01374.1 MFS transporter [Dactylosporangium matsuzakiense]